MSDMSSIGKSRVTIELDASGISDEIWAKIGGRPDHICQCTSSNPDHMGDCYCPECGYTYEGPHSD